MKKSIRKKYLNYVICIVIGLAFIRIPFLNMCDFGDIRIESYFNLLYALFVFLSLIAILFSSQSPPFSIWKCMGIVIFVLLNCLRPDLEKYVDESIQALLVFMIIPFLFIQYINDKGLFLKIFNVFIFLHFLLGVEDCLLFMGTGQNYGKDAMLATYAIAIPTSYYLYEFFESDKYKFLYAILAVVGISFSLLSGSRGCLILFVFSVLFGYLHIKEKKSVLYLFFGAAFFLIVFLSSWYDELMEGSRIIEAIQDNKMTSTERGALVWIPVSNAILDSPLIGWGTFGDRIVNSSHSWSHNLFLEVFCDYGIIIGTFFSIWLFSRTYFWTVVKKEKLIVGLFLMGIPQLLISSSFLQSSYFWIYIGFLLAGSNIFYRLHYSKQTPKYNENVGITGSTSL